MNPAKRARRDPGSQRRNLPSMLIRQWERALNEATTPATRKVALRITMVFGAEEGVFPVLRRRLARFGLKGKMASGKQYVSSDS